MASRAGITRRNLLRSAVAAMAGPYIVPAAALGRDGAVAPGDRITVGIIGTGNRSRAVMPAFLRNRDCQVLAV